MSGLLQEKFKLLQDVLKNNELITTTINNSIIIITSPFGFTKNHLEYISKLGLKIISITNSTRTVIMYLELK